MLNWMNSRNVMLKIYKNFWCSTIRLSIITPVSFDEIFLASWLMILLSSPNKKGGCVTNEIPTITDIHNTVWKFEIKSNYTPSYVW